MSSAICLIYLVTEYSWVFMLVSAFIQPCRQPAVHSHQTGCNPPWATPFFSVTYLFAFTLKWWFLFSFFHSWQSLPSSLVWHAWGAVLLLVLRCSGTSQCMRPAMKRKEESGYNPCLLQSWPFTPPPLPPRHFWGRALTSAGISPSSLLSLMRFLSAPSKTAPNSLCITRAFRWLLSRLPWLLFGSAAELLCGVRLPLHGCRDCVRCLIKYAFPVNMKSSYSLFVSCLRWKAPSTGCAWPELHLPVWLVP